MCGKRLNAWKTIPTRCRIRFTSTPRAVISSPSMKTRPALTGSSRLIQRSSVDLPEPEAPIRPTTSCSSTSRSTPLSTSSRSNDLWTSSIRRAAAGAISHPPHGLEPALVPRDQPVDEASLGDRDHDVHERERHVGREIEGRGRDDLRLLEGLRIPDDRDQGRVLLQPDEVVQ